MRVILFLSGISQGTVDYSQRNLLQRLKKEVKVATFFLPQNCSSPLSHKNISVIPSSFPRLFSSYRRRKRNGTRHEFVSHHDKATYNPCCISVLFVFLTYWILRLCVVLTTHPPLDFTGTSYGKGVYFARDASYSIRFSKDGRSRGDYCCMYLSRVLVGEYCKGDPRMIVPPPKHPSQPEILFDSAVDKTKNPTIFVVFFDNQCYPEYLITFT